MLQLGIFLFDNVEVLDFAGPFEVFSVASQLSDYKILHVSTFGEEQKAIRTVNGLQVIPDYGLENLHFYDFLVVPGGDGSKQVIQNPALLDSIQEKIKASKWTMSVRSGSRILGKLGFLDGLNYRTHHQVYDDMLKNRSNGISAAKRKIWKQSVFGNNKLIIIWLSKKEEKSGTKPIKREFVKLKKNMGLKSEILQLPNP